MIDRLLLCTDLDRTLVPNGGAPESPGARELFSRLAARPEVCLAYVSGRDAARVSDAMREYKLPLPDHVVADVGTSIYDLRDGSDWIGNQQWEAEIRQDWGHCGRDRLSEALARIPFLWFQEESKQNRFKLSYYFPTGIPQSQVTDDASAQLADLGIPVTLVSSIDEPRDVGLLDVLPERASKLHAIRFLMREFGFGIEQTVFCGDSGNDLSVLASKVPGILVANASATVQRAALQLAEQAGTREYLYIATGSFMNMNGNYAAGILEGVAHFHPDIAGWIAVASGLENVRE